MKKTFYLPSDDPGKLLWLNDFANALAPLAATLGISPAALAQVQDDLATFSAVIVYLNSLKASLESLTAFKNQVRNGTATLGALPALPPLPVLPAGALNNVFGRIRLLVRTIKGNANYTETIGQALKIIGDEQADDSGSWKPILTYKLVAGQPDILWTKGNSHGIKLRVDRNDGQGFAFLAVDTIPNYLDRHALPAPGQSAVWKYVGTYMLNDEEVGEQSDVLEVTVKGPY